ncbi:LysR family transcriptional regulator [Burkholderia stabilis]|uniref:LysR family transcriptional regulator n=1 Tax=Burkholderia stabilis TaxID=95485 RepID=UPI0023EA74B4|nr:LysR family transcriptional regulator [Burkholderia stabilis]
MRPHLHSSPVCRSGCRPTQIHASALSRRHDRAASPPDVMMEHCVSSRRSIMSARILQEAAVRYFLEVVNAGSVADAATRLNVVPSAVSRQIARLENELGTPLFVRQSRGMVPSKAGEMLAAYARRSQLDAEQISLEIDALRGEAERTIRIACTEGFAANFLPRVMADFRRTVAPASFEVVVDTAADVTQRVRDGECDIGLTFSFGPSKDIQICFSRRRPYSRSLRRLIRSRGPSRCRFANCWRTRSRCRGCIRRCTS